MIYQTKEEAIQARKAKDRARYLKNRVERLKREKIYRAKHPEKGKKDWLRIKNDPKKLQKYKERTKRFRLRRREDILSHYSNGEMKCACCGENHIEFLAIDHINNDGYKHRKVVKGSDFYRWLKRNNYPKGFQVLCHNCNFARGVYGKCPHSCPSI